MASYNYRAKTSNGETVSGRFDAPDKNMVVALLRSKGLYPIHIEENVTAGKEIKLGSSRKVKIKDLAIFCRQFQTMLNAGVSVMGCLDMLRKQTENPRLVGVINKVYDDVQKGIALSESMKNHGDVFPVLLTSMIEVGEVSGTLDITLERLAAQFEKDNKTRQKISTAMTYPMVISILALVMVVFMLTVIVPKFVGMLGNAGAKLPLPTQILVNISHMLTDVRSLLVIVGSIAFIVYAFKKFKKSSQGKAFLDRLIIKMPIIGPNVKKIMASRFTRTLSSLLKSGVPLIQALEVVEKVVNNHLVTQGMERVREDIRRGSNLAGPLESIGIFPVMVTQMISIGEEAGALDSIMGKVADFYDDEVDASISKLISTLEPVMIFVLAILVGAIVVSMMLPIFSMYGAEAS